MSAFSPPLPPPTPWSHLTCRILVSWSGIEPGPPAVKAQSPNHWTAREFLLLQSVVPQTNPMYHSSLTPLLIQASSEHVYKDNNQKGQSLTQRAQEKHIGVKTRHSMDCVCMVSRVQLCHPMDCSLTASSAYGISQARILEWVAISSSRGSSWPRDQTHLSFNNNPITNDWLSEDSIFLKHAWLPGTPLK